MAAIHGKTSRDPEAARLSCGPRGSGMTPGVAR